MRSQDSFELPAQLQEKFAKAKKLERITIGYLITVVIVMYLVLGTSQAMKTAWLEDVLSLFPAIAFLVASKYHHRRPDKKFRYGYHRVFEIAFFAGAFSLFAMGVFMAIDSSISLINMDHPTIGSTTLFGQQIWMGWIMILALLYSAIPAMILGHKKLPLARELHGKILFTDAEAQKADYMTAFAAILGIVGIGYGLWWSDALAALFISFSVLKDGFGNLKNSIQDLMDRIPVPVDENKADPLIGKIENLVRAWDWVENVAVRFREHGPVYFGEIYVVVKNSEGLVENLEKGVKELKAHHWKIHDVLITPVDELPKWEI
jgi:cation diffusion facilitator family transporter